MLNLDYNLIKALIVFVDARSVTRAAERLHLSQPAASAVLQKLREAMDDPVLVRSGNTMVPTERAVMARQKAQSIDQQLAAVFEPDMPFDPATSEQSFRIAVTDYALYNLIPRLLGRMVEKAPKVSLDFHSLDRWPHRRDILESLKSGSLDAIVGMSVAVGKDIRTRSLVSEPFWVLGPASPRRSRLTLNQFLSRPHLLVSFSGDRLGLVDEALTESGLHRTVAHTLSNYLEGALILQQAAYYLVAPQSVAQMLAERFELQAWPLPIEMAPLSVSLYWHRSTDGSPAHQWLRNQLL